MKIQIGLAPLLALIFISFKVTNLITWSWLWVLSPLWIGYSIVLIAGLILSIISFFIK